MLFFPMGAVIVSISVLLVVAAGTLVYAVVGAKLGGVIPQSQGQLRCGLIWTAAIALVDAYTQIVWWIYKSRPELYLLPMSPFTYSGLYMLSAMTEAARRASILIVVLLGSLGLGVVRATLSRLQRAGIFFLTTVFGASRILFFVVIYGTSCQSTGCENSIWGVYLVLLLVSILVYISFVIWTLCAICTTMRAHRLSQASDDEVLDDSVAMRYRWLRRRIIFIVVSLLLALAIYRPKYVDGPEICLTIADALLLLSMCFFTYPTSWWQWCNSAFEPAAADGITMTLVSRITDKVADKNPTPLPISLEVTDDVDVL